MQVFVPYREPILVAQCLDWKRLHKQIIECKQILDAISGTSKAWSNHPIVKMYTPGYYQDFLLNYRYCLWHWVYGTPQTAQLYNDLALDCIPEFIDEEFCIQHRRRLYTKAPDLYPQFAEYGTSEENWYIVDENLIKYINGKRLL